MVLKKEEDEKQGKNKELRTYSLWNPLKAPSKEEEALQE